MDKEILEDIKLICQMLSNENLGYMGQQGCVCTNCCCNTTHTDPDCPALKAEEISKKYGVPIETLEELVNGEQNDT